VIYEVEQNYVWLVFSQIFLSSFENVGTGHPYDNQGTRPNRCIGKDNKPCVRMLSWVTQLLLTVTRTGRKIYDFVGVNGSQALTNGFTIATTITIHNSNVPVSSVNYGKDSTTLQV